MALKAYQDPAPPPAPVLWFTAKSGSTTCSVSKVFQSPIRITYLCVNPYGSTTGAYTATPTAANAQNGNNYVSIGMSSIPTLAAPSAAGDSLSCLIQMNGTSSPAMMLNGQTIPPTSATYQCQGFTTIGASSIAWP